MGLKEVMVELRVNYFCEMCSEEERMIRLRIEDWLKERFLVWVRGELL